MGQARTERKRAEKAANREAKIAKKEAHVVEDKKRRMGNGWLALLIFGVVALMFLFVWGYNYFSKATSIESYIADNGGKDTYSNMMLSENTKMSVTAKKNDMEIVINIADENSEDATTFGSEDGVNQMKYYAAYWMGTIKPLVRGSSATATVVAKANGKKINTATVDWSEADKILQQYGMSVDQIQQQIAQQKAQQQAAEEAAAQQTDDSAKTEDAAE